jgi:tRNA threonylcarbamoyladenosine biosynthesis protein TsaE
VDALAILVPVPAQVLTREVTTHSAEETTAFGRALVDLLAPPKLVLLRGDLGAGKTTLIKGIAAGFQAASEDDVTSPTFTLVHEYRGPQVTIYHVDLYRVDSPRELETLGLDDLLDNGLVLIEWGEKFPRFARDRDVEITIERLAEHDRRIRIVTR